MRAETSGWLQNRTYTGLSARLLLGLLLLLVTTNCGLCDRVEDKQESSSSASSLASLIPGDVGTAVFVGDWKDLRDGLHVLNKRFGTQLPIEAGLAEFKRNFGLDLQQIESLETLGIRTSAGLAVVQVERSRVVYIPLDAPNLFEKFARTLATERLGASPEVITKEIEGNKLHFWIKPAAQDAQKPPTVTEENLVLAYTIKGKKAIVFPGKNLMTNRGDAEVVLGKILRLKPEKSLRNNADFTKLRDSVGKEYPFFVLVDLPGQVRDSAEEVGQYSYGKKDAARLQKIADQLGHTGLGIKIDTREIHVHAQLLTQGELHQKLDRATKAVAAPKYLTRSLENAPIAMLKLAVDPDSIFETSMGFVGDLDRAEIDEQLQTWEKRLGVKLKEELLPAVDGNMMLAIYDLNPLALGRLSLDSVLNQTRSALVMGLRVRKKLLASLDNMVEKSGGLASKTDKNGLLIFRLGEPGSGPSLVLGEKVVLLASRKLEEEASLQLAQLKGDAQQNKSLQDKRVSQIFSQQNGSVLTLDPGLLLDKLGPLGQSARPVLSGFDLWSLTAQYEKSGPVMDLRMTFPPAEKNPPGQ